MIFTSLSIVDVDVTAFSTGTTVRTLQLVAWNRFACLYPRTMIAFSTNLLVYAPMLGRAHKAPYLIA